MRTVVQSFPIAVALLLLIGACATSAADPTDSLPAAAPSDTSPSLPSPVDPNGQGDASPPPSSSAGACPKKCVATDDCFLSECDAQTKKCVEKPKPDGYGCSKGECIAGKCEPIAACFGEYPQQFLHCDGASAWYRDLSTTLYPKNKVSSYACAKGEVASEVALEFDPPEGANVTVKLKVTNGPDADLDLIVLEKVCLGGATCANAPVAGGGVAGVTPGTGTETVTFTAGAKKYYVVIDGKVTTPVAFRVEVSCAP